MTYLTASTPNLVNAPSHEWATGSAKPSSLATLWARKYVSTVTESDRAPDSVDQSLSDFLSPDGRSHTITKLKKILTQASAQGWSLTETLLDGEIARHGIAPDLVDPWAIAASSHKVLQKTLDAYLQAVTPQRLSVLIGADLGQIRHTYTAVDPRVIGFVSMQFHYTGKYLLERVSPLERSLLLPYLKVIDDHLYMPLQRAYDAAALHSLDSSALRAVQHLLPQTTAIAHAVCNQIYQLYPTYESYSGSLNSTSVRISSLRDVEMFQVYLCLCLLENSIQSVQQELFPLCVMLYPRLRVSWRLVQEMLHQLKWELHDRLERQDVSVLFPYLHTLMEMFSPEIFVALEAEDSP